MGEGDREAVEGGCRAAAPSVAALARRATSPMKGEERSSCYNPARLAFAAISRTARSASSWSGEPVERTAASAA